ncbi:hypothetical protein Ancab_021732 [Ancistrocladus abbreviatus]
MILGTLHIRPASKAMVAPKRFRVHCSESRIVEAKKHHTMLDKRNSGKKSLVEWSSDGHVPSQGELVAGTFMEDETPVIKKGKKEKTMGPSSAKLSPVCYTEIGSLSDVEGSNGLYPRGPVPNWLDVSRVHKKKGLGIPMRRNA